MNKILKKLGELDAISRFVFILVFIIFAYILIICFIIPLILSPTNGFSEEYLLSFGTSQHRHLNLISFLLSMVLGAMFAVLIRKRENNDDMTIIKTVLSPADKKVISILEEVEDITQDSLMFRLEWSRAKVSTILTNLEKRGLIQRRREGKTYVVFLSKKIKNK